MKSFVFTKKDINRLEIPKRGREYYKDEKEKGLSLYITSNGIVTFFIRKRVNKKDEKIIIGNFPEIGVSGARVKAMQIKTQIAVGESLVEEDAKIKHSLTFEKMFEEYVERYSKKEKSTWKEDAREIKQYLGYWITKEVSEITKEDVIALHREIGDVNGIYQANHILKRMRSIYNKHIEWGWRGDNPAVGIKQFKEESRDRFLSSEELTRFWRAVNEEENEIIRDYILISILTGARKSNVLSMTWCQIDFYSKIWKIPRTKNGDPINIPLTDDAIDIIKKRKKGNKNLGFEDSHFVFPGRGKTGHIIAPQKVWKGILKKAKIENLRLHDLRRTLGSWQAIT